MFVLSGRDFGEGTLELGQGQIEREVVDMLSRMLKLFE